MFLQFVERTATSIEITEQKKVENTTTTSILNSSKRISIVKPLSSVTPKTTHPFLIAKCDLNLGHLSRKSFLNRNSPLLEKLVSLTRTGSDNEPILNKTKGKGNYVFVATEKKNVSVLNRMKKKKYIASYCVHVLESET